MTPRPRDLTGTFTIVLLAACVASPTISPAANAATGKTKTVTYSFPHAETWFSRHQASDGTWANAAGEPDLEATCLCTLALLGDGSTMRAGPYRLQIKNAMRWLLNQQQADGTFASTGRDCIREQALATYLMVEAAGLSKYRLLWQPAISGLQAVMAHRDANGGWRSHGDQEHTDARTTGWCTLAILSARRFQDSVPDDLNLPASLPATKELLTWFDQHPAKTTEAAAIDLLCRRFAGQAATVRPELLHAANRPLADSQARDAYEVFWTTYALSHVGGTHLQHWQEQLKDLAATKAHDLEDLYQYGSWPPSGELSRAATTALFALSEQVYYRYAKLLQG